MLKHAQRGETYAGYNDLKVMVCPECGVLYAIPERLRESAERRGGFKRMWYCPNGHHLGYGERPEQRLKRDLAAERERSARLAAQRDQAEASARAERAAKTRFKNDRDRERQRAAAGVCPCCNRTFKQLARHMRSQHPNFPAEEA